MVVELVELSDLLSKQYADETATNLQTLMDILRRHECVVSWVYSLVFVFGRPGGRILSLINMSMVSCALVLGGFLCFLFNKWVFMHQL